LILEQPSPFADYGVASAGLRCSASDLAYAHDDLEDPSSRFPVSLSTNPRNESASNCWPSGATMMPNPAFGSAAADGAPSKTVRHTRSAQGPRMKASGTRWFGDSPKARCQLTESMGWNVSWISPSPA
jgi:hypothetical protein